MALLPFQKTVTDRLCLFGHSHLEIAPCGDLSGDRILGNRRQIFRFKVHIRVVKSERKRLCIALIHVNDRDRDFQNFRCDTETSDTAECFGAETGNRLCLLNKLVSQVPLFFQIFLFFSFQVILTEFLNGRVFRFFQCFKFLFERDNLGIFFFQIQIDFPLFGRERFEKHGNFRIRNLDLILIKKMSRQQFAGILRQCRPFAKLTHENDTTCDDQEKESIADPGMYVTERHAAFFYEPDKSITDHHVKINEQPQQCQCNALEADIVQILFLHKISQERIMVGRILFLSSLVNAILSVNFAALARSTIFFSASINT